MNEVEETNSPKKKKTMNKITKINPPEKKRTYYFKDGIVELENVIELSVSDSGTHRLKTLDGHHHIVPTGWMHIELDIDKWTT